MASTTVLFDLDDTLTDAATFGASVLADAVQAHGRALAIEVIQQYPGAPYVPLIQDLLNVRAPEAEAIYATYVRRYRETMPAGLRERAGASALLGALAAREVRLALVTNKLERLAREILVQFGWDGLFGAVVGQDSCAFQKPHPGIALHALSALDGRPEAAAFVGDTPSDMRCARDAGIVTIVGLLGTTVPAALTAAGATHLCAGLDEVLAVLDGSAR